MKDEIETTILYDIYSPLLTERQAEIMKMSLYYDNSLSEIAEEYDISRQSVKDAIDNATRLLYEYESKLHYKEKKDRLLCDVRSCFDEAKRENSAVLQDRLNGIIEQLEEF